MHRQFTEKSKKSVLPFCFRALTFFLLFVFVIQSLSAYAHAAGEDDSSADMLTENHYATPSFSSTLPILVLDMPENEQAQDANGYFLDAGLTAFDGPDENVIGDSSSVSVSLSLRNMTDRTSGSGNSRKSDYYLRLDEAESILGLETTTEYLLLGGEKDKSLIRNYLGYTLAAQVMETAPASRLCEVFFRTANGELYQGVYLLVELQLRENAVLFHRNTTGEGIAIETYSTENDPAAGYISIPFMESTQWEERLSEPIGQLSIAESVLYSTNSSTFYEYTEWFDVPSFAGSFIVGELTENYAGMTDTYYCYDPDTGSVFAAPVWNFEEAFDNSADEPVNPEQIKYQEAPYFELFFRSPQFAKEVQSAYLQARRGALNEEAVARLVDEAAAYVSPAVGRDWSRWNSYSGQVLLPLTEIEIDDETVRAIEPLSRQTATYAEELLRLKYQLREHNLSMALQLTQFDFSEREISREIVLNTNPVWVVLFLVVFFLFVRFARRYGV